MVLRHTTIAAISVCIYLIKASYGVLVLFLFITSNKSKLALQLLQVRVGVHLFILFITLPFTSLHNLTLES